MGENRWISEMASKVSEEIFEVFKWSKCSGTDMSWSCVSSEEHGGKKDHPTDCVFYYRDPYTNEMVYVNTDLKSYKKSTINYREISKAIYSLSYATNCASVNPNWKDLFKPEIGSSVRGMLFIYNHCGEYRGDFPRLINEIGDSHNRLSCESSIFICDPYKVRELCSIAADIRQMIGKKELPSEESFCFYHPNKILINNHFDAEYLEPATLEVLSSPWIILKHSGTEKVDSGYVVYYTREGDSIDEFIYLIDALSYYQIINNKEFVRIKLTKKSEKSSANLKEAINRHLSDLGFDNRKIEKVTREMMAGTIALTIPQLSERELGVMP